MSAQAILPPLPGACLDPEMIPPPVAQEILRRLQQAEQEHEVKVLLAVESGSRAWGFASPNSDYDARFIYIRRPECYFSLNPVRDVIEYPIVDEIDINGWDLHKALRLFGKSNPGFVEWIHSPLVYGDRTGLAAAARALLSQVYQIDSGITHYHNMALNNYRNHLQHELVALKKYFYVLRPLLAVRWLRKHAQAAPIEFATLLQTIAGEEALLQAIDELLQQKRAAAEMQRAPRKPQIHAFIESELPQLAARGKPQPPAMPQSALPTLSALLRQQLCLAWEDGADWLRQHGVA